MRIFRYTGYVTEKEMENQLYYALMVCNDDVGAKAFRRPSNLPYPSPLGTRIDIYLGDHLDEVDTLSSSDECICASVDGHLHRFQNDGHREMNGMYMILRSVDRSEITTRNAKAVWGAFVSAGWEEIDPSFL
jgi:hypothetical protein